MPPIIEVNHLSKEYERGRSIHQETLREFLVRNLNPLAWMRTLSSSTKESRKFRALNDVSFQVGRGDVVGILGRNGAGKSTLLKAISKVTDPTSGSITLRGRLGSLLEVGTGFHPELTGRENVYLNGAILGMSKSEIDACFDAIIDFSEINKFLDIPVKRYSSGMYLRLAFAVAAHLNTEILIADEVLAVGDIAFQRKCLRKMNEVARQGRTVLFVSHNMAAVADLCSRGIVLDAGKLIFDGSAKQAIQMYIGMMFHTKGAPSHIIDLRGALDRRSPQGKLLEAIEMYTDNDQPLLTEIKLGGFVKIRVHFNLPIATSSYNVGLGFNNAVGQRVFTAHTLFEPNRDHATVSGPQVLVCEIPSLTLAPGDYVLRVWLDVGNTEADLIDSAARITVLESDFYGGGKLPGDGMFVLNHSWALSS
ncbi:MAG TPA: ABC transporter ATP-binding protein [Terriglobales bacterium]|nr:ABC transporter ATP-binding protein [Terriglobales bacterium]